MATLPTCLVDVVGLSQTLCECWENGQPNDYNTSLSGLYLADLLPLKWTNSAKDCEKGGVWSILQTARNSAITMFLAELAAAISRFRDSNFMPFIGWVGSVKFADSLSVLNSGNYAGLRLKPKRIQGGRIVLRGVELNLQSVAPGTVVNVLVYSNRDLTALLGSVAVTLTTAGKFYGADFATPIQILLDGKDANGFTYSDFCTELYIVYQMPNGARYVNNQIYEAGTACCGQKPTAAKASSALQYVSDIDGIESPTIAAIETPTNTGQNAYGLRLKADYECDETAWLCGLPYAVATVGTGRHKVVARIVAQALYMKAGELTANAILDSTNINSITILMKEELYGKRSKYTKAYADALIWIAQNLPPDLSDCLACKKTQFVATLPR